MNGKRMICNQVMFRNAVADLSDRAFRLYINIMLYADDDGFVDKLRFAKMVSGAEDKHLEELVGANLIAKLDGNNVLVLDWLIHNNLDSKTYNNKAPAEVRDRIRVEANKRYTLNDALPNTMSIDEYRFAKSEKRAKK